MELLHALHDVFVLHVVQAHEGCHVGVEGGEGLGARPLVLESAEEVDDLPHAEEKCLGGAEAIAPPTPLKPSWMRRLRDQPAQYPANMSRSWMW